MIISSIFAISPSSAPPIHQPIHCRQIKPTLYHSSSRWIVRSLFHNPLNAHTLPAPTRSISISTSLLVTNRGDVGKSRLVKKTNRRGKSIKEKEILVIDETGENLGILSADMAVQMARGRGLELTQVQKGNEGSNAVYKFVSKKQLYDEKKEQKQRTKKDPLNVMKTVQISTKIGEHDLDIKLNRIEQFLAKSHTVRVSIEGKFRRYFSDSEVAHEKKRRVELLKSVETKLTGLGSKVTKDGVPEGRNLRCDFRPVANAQTEDLVS